MYERMNTTCVEYNEHIYIYILYARTRNRYEHDLAKR